uniref:Uncharacterized protein n=1 Tax=Strigamia maritima TaxID=126957 RepID=T1JHJ6_STRMM
MALVQNQNQLLIFFHRFGTPLGDECTSYRRNVCRNTRASLRRAFHLQDSKSTSIIRLLLLRLRFYTECALTDRPRLSTGDIDGNKDNSKSRDNLKHKLPVF